MERIINTKELTTFTFEATPEECKEVALEFDFDKISYIKGTFTIKPTKKILPCLVIEGTIEALVEINEAENLMQESLALYLIEKESDLEKFDIYHDVEILENGQVDIGSVIGQYVYLASVSPHEQI